MAVDFANPWWLLALPAAAALLAAIRRPWWRAARRSGPPALRREVWRTGLRLLWVTLLVLALSGATVTRPLRRQAMLLVLDASASMQPVADQVADAARAAIAGLTRRDLAGVVAAASGARVEEPPAADPLFHRLTTALPGDETDLAAGVRLAAAMVPPGFAGRVVLVTDGRQTRGDAVAAAREAAAGGITVDVLPLGAGAGPDVRIESLDLAETAYQGETPVLKVRLFTARDTAATVRVQQDDQVILERPVDLRSGRQELALPVPAGDPGLHRYQVQVTALDPAADATHLNNALGAVQRVVGPPRVLVIATDPAAAGYLPAALQAGGAEVTLRSPATLPADLANWARYDAAVLAGVPAHALPPGTMEQMERFVRDLGRGLVMTGSPDSFGPGGYADTPVERALPVYMDLRGRGRQPQVAMLLVVDKSGSMSGEKMEMAKEAAVRSIRLLRPGDRAGILAFDSVPQWVAPLTPTEAREQLEEAIGRVYAGGGTEIFPAVSAGFAALKDVTADVRHIILLTDGRSGSGGEYAKLLDEMRAARITLSTVAVGQDADSGLMEAMARAGRGRYHFAGDPASIPQVFSQETLMATRTVLVDLRFHPAATGGGPLLSGLQQVPRLDGYVAVTAKERAEVLLISPEGDPVLTAWQYGTGRAVAWTPDVGGRWSNLWSGSPAASTLWGNVLSWLLPPQGAGQLTVRTEAAAGGAVTITAENPTDWELVRPTQAVLLGPEGLRRTAELTPAGPGLYQAKVGDLPPGAYVIQVRQEVPGAAPAHLQAETGWVAPYPAEYRDAGVDGALLAQVAAAGGGRVLAAPAEAATAPPRSAAARWPLAPLLLGVAALGWPLEIAARRLVFSGALSRSAPPAADPGLASAAPGARDAPAGARAAGPAGGTSGRGQPPPAPAEDTAQRLLQRKRNLRDGKKPR